MNSFYLSFFFNTHSVNIRLNGIFSNSRLKGDDSQCLGRQAFDDKKKIFVLSTHRYVGKKKLVHK